MFTIYRKEMNAYLKTLCIWVACVAGMGFLCIMMYSGMQEDMQEMADNFASMGAFSDAFGMSQLSIATLVGFYATEVGTIHGLGGAMFAAIISAVLLSKEEDGHTGEFLFSLPVARGKVVIAKWCAFLTHIVLFNAVSVLVYVLGFVILGEEIPVRDFLFFHLMQVMLEIEVGAVCYAISAFMRKNKLGVGLGVALLFYAYDMIARVVPDIADSKFLSPFSYANAADIFSTGELYSIGILVGAGVICVAMVVAYTTYVRRDLMS